MTDLQFPYGLLKVAGYADALGPALVPRVVPPVFVVNNNPSAYVVPPYRLEADGVVYKRTWTRSEVERLESLGNITLTGEVAQARPGHLMWLDEESQIRYESATQVVDSLRQCVATHAAAGWRALRNDRPEDALRHADVALLAEDNCWEALVIKGTAYSLLGRDDLVVCVAEAAAEIRPDAEFNALVRASVADHIAHSKQTGCRRPEETVWQGLGRIRARDPRDVLPQAAA
jgi:hypothetical protein